MFIYLHLHTRLQDVYLQIYLPNYLFDLQNYVWVQYALSYPCRLVSCTLK